MVNIIDCTVIEFEKNLQGKKVIAFGAGRKFVSFVERHNLQDKIKKYDYIIPYLNSF